ncbi:DNA repair protein RadC [Listeria rocourtiae]|uniref:RadC family protein n=1 Tax=Listeria rocourtiae TaxID=647910 RepID=UPI001626953D|nr:DNA repair protein RadC [Listeria rocourtiae]MBC1434422.1 DNA repair protein RadC [Listeria rocourtiae]MBC1603918.1 DNA repair protein RadC [Listeria rocourtiae]
MFIREMSNTEKPRERLQKKGVSSLSNIELFAIILETGSRKESVVDLANRVVAKYSEIADMREITLQELTEINGIGLAKAAKVLAAIEISKRLGAQKVSTCPVIRGPQDGADLVMQEMSLLSQEHFHCVFLSTRNKLVHRETIFIGSLNSSVVHPREIFKQAMKYSSASVMCFHNHPSGDATPSTQDITVTKRLKKAGDLLGIPLIDHIIIGNNTFISLKQEGYF